MPADPPVVARFGGAAVRRIVDRSHALVPEHAHDWPVLSLFVMGGYLNRTELGECRFNRPSVILYRPGAGHENEVGAHGFEQIEIEFDPRWLGDVALADTPVTRWEGRAIAAASRNLARCCGTCATEQGLGSALRSFFEIARNAPEPSAPAWLPRLERELESSAHINVGGLAERVGRHPFWVSQAYRDATGETLRDAVARMRVQRASKLLRETSEGAAAIALEAGFCDQSHMIRVFRRLLGRTPSEVRADPLRDARQCFPGASVKSEARFS